MAINVSVNKEWYKSKTVWAAVFSAGVVVASTILGETSLVVTAAITIGSAFGIYGRFTVNAGLK